MSRDSLPHLGRHEGRWYALGYSGSGVAMAPYLGHKVALRLLGDAGGETPFEQTAFPSVPFFSGQSWFLAPLELWYRVKDWREGSP
jgi:glycine/D-amino acid oxidase-like deaminating enzyme